MTAEQAFYKVFKGTKNFMTPNILKRETIETDSWKKFHYEVSSDRGLDREPIYGLTVIQELKTGLKKRDDLSDMISEATGMSEANALAKIDAIINTLFRK